LRDGSGFLAEFFIIDDIDILGLKKRSWEPYVYYGVMGIDMRRAIAFRYYETGSPFEYEMLRLLYTQKRKFDIAR